MKEGLVMKEGLIKNGLQQDPQDARADALIPFHNSTGQNLAGQSSAGASNDQLRQITRLARLHYGVEIAFVTLIDENQHRIVASQGLTPEDAQRAPDLCQGLSDIVTGRAAQRECPLIVPDTTADPRFESSPLVIDRPFIRYLAAVPIREFSGLQIGSLCIGDTAPVLQDMPDMEGLQILASLIEGELDGRARDEVSPERVRTRFVNRSIRKAQAIFLSTEDSHAAFDALLDDLLNLTQAAFGFIGEVLYNESDQPGQNQHDQCSQRSQRSHSQRSQPYIKVRAITDISWDAHTARMYDQVNKQGMVFERLDNLLGAAVIAREVVISDNVSSDPRRGGIRHGHPPISTYMGIPVFSGASLVGLIGLANRPGGFSKRFARDLEPLSNTVGTLIERQRLYAEKARQQEILERAANFDALTNLPNRRFLNELFDRKIQEAARNGGTLSVCFLDLDGFKDVNDRYGHKVGDAVLQNVASRLAGIMRSVDVVARLSGDEFIALIADVTDPGVYQRVLDCIEEPISYRDHLVKLSGSMGITVYPDNGLQRDTLLRHADQAMYRAKGAGKNRYVFFEPKD